MTVEVKAVDVPSQNVFGVDKLKCCAIVWEMVSNKKDMPYN